MFFYFSRRLKASLRLKYLGAQYPTNLKLSDFVPRVISLIKWASYRPEMENNWQFINQGFTL